jgi:hypothetical protein
MRYIKHIAVVTLVAGIALCQTDRLGADADGWKAFEQTWRGRHVVLKQPLYSIIATDAGNVLSEPGPKTNGVTVISPSNGTYYEGLFGGKEHRDRDVQQLTAKASAATANMTRQKNITVYEHVKGNDAQLVTFKVGAAMTVKTVGHRGDRLWIGLYDDLTTKGPEV